MNRRTFLRTGAALGGLAPFGLGSLAGAATPEAAIPAGLPPAGDLPCNNIRQYLIREAARITDRAAADFGDAGRMRSLQSERRVQFLEMMGLGPEWIGRREAPPVVVTGIVERERYRIEKLYYQSLPGLYVTANLYLPKGAAGKVPGVLYVCGHLTDQKVSYQAHPRRLAELGFACLIVETIEGGEVVGNHHGCVLEGWWHWYSRGYTPAGIEMLNGFRGLDLLASRPEVNPEKLGVTGISGGGAATWWIAAGDPRIKVAAPVCGTSTIASHVRSGMIDNHCDCMWWINTRGWDLSQVGALIAPRPLLIASADTDALFTLPSIRAVHAQLGRLYATLDAPEKLRLVVTPGGHSYHERSRTGIFSWFTKHLMGRDVPPAQIGDIDERPESQESLETLRVYVGGPPAGNRTTTIQDDFLPAPKPPEIADPASLARARDGIVAALREAAFAAFPAEPPPLDLEIEYRYLDRPKGFGGLRFAFTSEEGWRLCGMVLERKTAPSPAPALVALRSPWEGRLDTLAFLRRIKAPCAGVQFETRGTGETSWGEDFDWHLRRASAWTGRTLASMRVWDTLRALEAVRRLPGVDPGNVSLAARRDMGAVALYAALLDGKVRSVLLVDPPATQDAPSEPDGRGPAIEMLRCLRVTDLPQVAGLLWPAELVFAGSRPASYDWARDLFARLGTPAGFRSISDPADWTAAA